MVSSYECLEGKIVANLSCVCASTVLIRFEMKTRRSCCHRKFPAVVKKVLRVCRNSLVTMLLRVDSAEVNYYHVVLFALLGGHDRYIVFLK